MSPCGIPVILVIARRGTTMEHLPTHLKKADAVLAASLFHYREVEIAALKCFLRHVGCGGIPVRLPPERFGIVSGRLNNGEAARMAAKYVFVTGGVVSGLGKDYGSFSGPAAEKAAG